MSKKSNQERTIIHQMTPCATPSCQEIFLHGGLPYCLECLENLLEIRREVYKNYEQYNTIKQKYIRFQKALRGYTDAQKTNNCIPTEKQMRRVRQKNAHFIDEADETADLKDLKEQKEHLCVKYKEGMMRLKDEYDYVVSMNK